MPCVLSLSGAALCSGMSCTHQFSIWLPCSLSAAALQVMGAMCAACRRAVLEADPRLVEALYLCQVQAAAEALSGVYAVLGRRRARILQVSRSLRHMESM